MNIIIKHSPIYSFNHIEVEKDRNLLKMQTASALFFVLLFRKSPDQHF